MPPADARQLAAILDEARAHEADETSAVIATDAVGTIVYWNERAESLYGWPAAQTLGRNIVDVTPTRQTADEAAHIMEDLRRGRTWSGSFIVQRSDGTPLLADVTDFPVREDRQVIGIIGLSRARAVR